MKVIILFECSNPEGCMFCPPALEIKGIYPYEPSGVRAAQQAKSKLEAKPQHNTWYELKICPVENCSDFLIPTPAEDAYFYPVDKEEKLWGHTFTIEEWGYYDLRIIWVVDSDDESLLRFEVWDEDRLRHSCRTLFPSTASAEQQQEALWLIAQAIMANPKNMKQVCRQMKCIHLDEQGIPSLSKD